MTDHTGLHERDPEAVLAALAALRPGLAAPVPGPGLLVVAEAIGALLVTARGAPPVPEMPTAGDAAPDAAPDAGDGGDAFDLSEEEPMVAVDGDTVIVTAPGVVLTSRRLADATTTTHVSVGSTDWVVDHDPGARYRVRVREGDRLLTDWAFGPSGAVDNRDLEHQLAAFRETAQQALEAMVPPGDLAAGGDAGTLGQGGALLPRAVPDPARPPEVSPATGAGPADLGAGAPGVGTGAAALAGAAAAALRRRSRDAQPGDAQPGDAQPGDAQAPATQAPATQAPAQGWQATHEVPVALAAWSTPDPSLQPVVTLEAGVQVRVLEQRGAWSRVECWNGWQAWVDGRQLAALG